MAKNKEKIFIKESKNFPGLFVKKYGRHVFYDNLWDADTIEARGHVVDKDGNVVIRPFTKIMNFQEKGIDGTPTTIDRDETVLAIRKVNGFMAAATYVEQYDQVIVSTTGSLDSDFVTMAKEIIGEYALNWIHEYGHDITFMFEVVHPNDPHIIQEEVGAYLIGTRRVCDGSEYTSFSDMEELRDKWSIEMNVMRPEWKTIRFGDLVKEMPTCKHEGFVVYGKDKVLKIKSNYYLASKAIARKQDILTLDKSRVDEEYFDLVDHIKGIPEQFNAMEEQDRLNYIRNYFLSNQQVTA